MNTTRRGFMAGAAASSLLLPGVLGGARAAGVTIGFIYVGSKADYGWNQSHAVAAATLKNTPGITVLEEENVPESLAVVQTMESMINIDGESLIFPTSFGYFNPFMLDAARKYPKVEFRHPTGLWNKDKDPMNAGGYYSYMDQGHYVNGVAAALSTKSNKIGYIAAKPIGLVLRNVNSFTVGVKKVNPNASVHLIITGDWSLPVREAEATQALIGTGCDVIACHVDSPKVVIETAEARGAKTLGHNADQSSLAPKGFITGAEMKWSTVYDAYAKLIAKGDKLPNVNEGGYDKDLVKSTAFGAGASEAARKAALAAIEDMKADKPIFVGGVKDNKGNVVSAKTLDLYEGSLWGTNYLIEGVVGSIT
jgi:basic membrane protein A